MISLEKCVNESHFNMICGYAKNMAKADIGKERRNFVPQKKLLK